jgi:hypothetical protein
MSAQTVDYGGYDPRVEPLPHTIQAIGDALTGARRMAFYAEALSAPQGEALDAVLTRWWAEAMLSAVPGRELRLAQALADQGLSALPDLVDGGE